MKVLWRWRKESWGKEITLRGIDEVGDHDEIVVEKKKSSKATMKFDKIMGSVFRKVWGFLLGGLGCVISPTAVLHWMTGWTLIFAYAHGRTIEMELMAR